MSSFKWCSWMIFRSWLHWTTLIAQKSELSWRASRVIESEYLCEVSRVFSREILLLGRELGSVALCKELGLLEADERVTYTPSLPPSSLPQNWETGTPAPPQWSRFFAAIAIDFLLHIHYTFCNAAPLLVHQLFEIWIIFAFMLNICYKNIWPLGPSDMQWWQLIMLKRLIWYQLSPNCIHHFPNDSD